MTNKEAIESLKNIVTYWSVCPTEQEAARLAIKALEHQDKRWIPVSEKLPESYQRLVVQTKSGYLMLSRYHNNVFYNIEYFERRDKQGQIISDVIAWQPLPEPYEED